MKIRSSTLVSIGVLLSATMLLAACQGPTLALGQIRNQVTLSMSKYAKNIIAASGNKSLATSKSLAGAIGPQQISKQEFLAATKGQSGARFIHPETTFAVVMVEADDFETIDSYWSFSAAYDDLSLDVPQGTDRYFSVALFDSNGFLVGSTSFYADIIVNPTYILATVRPEATDYIDYNMIAAPPSPLLASGSTWHVIKMDFSSDTTDPGVIVNYSNDLNFNTMVVNGTCALFNEFGEELVLDTDYTISPSSRINGLSFSTTDPLTGIPYNFSEVYLVYDSGSTAPVSSTFQAYSYLP